MSTTTLETTTIITPEDLLAREDGDRYELVDGRLVELAVSLKSSWIAGEIAYFLRKHLETHRLGQVFPEGTGYRCFPNDPFRVRKPDVSFIRHGRITPEEFDEGYCPVAPDLVVEVVSPNDIHRDLAEKRDDYFSAGVPLLWVVEPETRSVTVFRHQGASISLLHVNEELTGDDILPEFRCPVADLFPRPDVTAKPPTKPEESP